MARLTDPDAGTLPPPPPAALSRRTVARNMAAVLLARGVDIAAGLLTLRLLAPYLGPAAYGDYAWVWAFVLAMQPVVNFEMERLMIREAARDRGRTRALWGAALSVKSVTLLGFVAVVAVSAFTLPLPPSMRPALLLAGLSEVFYHLHMLHSGVFQGRERMDADLGLMTTFRLVLLGAIVMGVARRWDLPLFFAAAAAANALRMALGGAVVLGRVGPPSFDDLRANVRHMLSVAWPITVAAVLAGLTLNVDVFILKALAPPEDVGYFQLAHPILLQLQIVPGALMTALFPGFARTFSMEPSRLSAFVREAAGVFFVIGGIGAILLWATATPIVSILGAGKFGPAGPVLATLALALPFLFGMTLFSFALVAADAERSLAVGSAMGLTANVALALALVPGRGAGGAALATVGAYAVMATAYAGLFTRAVPGAVDARLLLRMAAGAVPAAAFLILAPLPRPAAAALALAAVLGLSGSLALDALRRLVRPR